MNNIYLYDGSFSSLVSLIVELINKDIVPGGIRCVNNNMKGLFDCEFKLDTLNNSKNIQFIKKKLSKRIILSIYYAFLSEDNNIEIIIYEFIKCALIYKDKVYYMRRYNCVNKVIKLSGYVSREAHKLKGFLRFKEMNNNFLYAVISPTNNVLQILGKHFRKRLNGENFVIYDQLRKVYLIYNQIDIICVNEIDLKKDNINVSSSEENIEELWKCFHSSIAIDERKNLKCQMNFMPKKYWVNMIEMEDKL